MENKHKIANQSYYYNVTPDIFGSAESDSCDYGVPLRVNCCGEVVIRESWEHRTSNVRKDFYLIYSLGGDMVGSIGGEQVRIKSGQAICISPGTEYIFKTLSPLDEWTHYYWIHFTGSDVENTLARSRIETNKIYDILPCSDLYFHYERLFEEFRARPVDFEYAAALPLRDILLLLGRSRKDFDKERRLDKSIRYIHTHIRYDLSVEKLAAMEYLGVSRYRELFRSTMGSSPSDYITRLRITRAKDLLGQTSMSISEISEGAGYENRNYFQNTFKRITGMTPGEYRRSIIK